jgi:hypothetical protein
MIFSRWIFTRGVLQAVLQHQILNKRKCANKTTTQDALSYCFLMIKPTPYIYSLQPYSYKHYFSMEKRNNYISC